MSYRADGLSILLSSDWFLRAWPICGLQSPKTVRLCVRGACRDVVTDLLDGAESYWDAEFSSARECATERRLLECLIRCEVVSHDIQIFQGLIAEQATHFESPFDPSLVSNLLALLVAEYPKNGEFQRGISCRIFSVVSDAIFSSDKNQQISLMAEQADSKWDTWLKEITKEVPNFLANKAIDIFDACDGFSRSWATINETLNSAEKELLVIWLNRWGVHLAGKAAISNGP